MDIVFATPALREQCNSEAAALSALDPDVVRCLRARLDDLVAASCLSLAFKLPGRFRQHGADGQFAFDLADGVLLVLVPADEPLPLRKDGTVNLDQVNTVQVISIGSAHV